MKRWCLNRGEGVRIEEGHHAVKEAALIDFTGAIRESFDVVSSGRSAFLMMGEGAISVLKDSNNFFVVGGVGVAGSAIINVHCDGACHGGIFRVLTMVDTWFYEGWVEFSKGHSIFEVFIEDMVCLFGAVEGTNDVAPAASHWVWDIFWDLHVERARAILFSEFVLEECSWDVKVGHMEVRDTFKFDCTSMVCCKHGHLHFICSGGRRDISVGIGWLGLAIKGHSSGEFVKGAITFPFGFDPDEALGGDCIRGDVRVVD